MVLGFRVLRFRPRKHRRPRRASRVGRARGLAPGGPRDRRASREGACVASEKKGSRGSPAPGLRGSAGSSGPGFWPQALDSSYQYQPGPPYKSGLAGAAPEPELPIPPILAWETLTQLLKSPSPASRRQSTAKNIGASEC